MFILSNFCITFGCNDRIYFLFSTWFRVIISMWQWVINDVESLLTSILIEETINYIIEQSYLHKKVMPIFSKLSFRRLLIILATECIDSIADFSNKWMAALWEGLYLLLFMWLKAKNNLQYHLNLYFIEYLQMTYKADGN